MFKTIIQNDNMKKYLLLSVVLPLALAGNSFADNKWGVINRQGEFVAPAEYAQIQEFSEGLAVVKKDGKFGFIDRSGRQVVPCIYTQAFCVSCHMLILRRTVCMRRSCTRKRTLTAACSRWRSSCPMSTTGRPATA